MKFGDEFLMMYMGKSMSNEAICGWDMEDVVWSYR
jgi:hypothetical protein